MGEIAAMSFVFCKEIAGIKFDFELGNLCFVLRNTFLGLCKLVGQCIDISKLYQERMEHLGQAKLQHVVVVHCSFQEVDYRL